MTFALVAALASSFASPALAASLDCVGNPDCSATCDGTGFDAENTFKLVPCDSSMNCDYDFPSVTTDVNGDFSDFDVDFRGMDLEYPYEFIYSDCSVPTCFFPNPHADMDFAAQCVAFLACGDGVLDEGEACDDGANEDGDGCSAACIVEFGWTCEGEPSVCSEAPAGDEVMPVTDSSVRIVLGLVAAFLVVVVVLCVIV